MTALSNSVTKQGRKIIAKFMLMFSQFEKKNFNLNLEYRYNGFDNLNAIEINGLELIEQI